MPWLFQYHDGVQPRPDGRAVWLVLGDAVPADGRQSASDGWLPVPQEDGVSVIMNHAGGAAGCRSPWQPQIDTRRQRAKEKLRTRAIWSCLLGVFSLYAHLLQLAWGLDVLGGEERMAVGLCRSIGSGWHAVSSMEVAANVNRGT